MDRKLAAILAADVVGYSALMEADEVGTHERLKAGRKELFKPEIAAKRLWPWAAAIAAAAVAALAAVWFTVMRPAGPPTPSTIPSIAVLPFDNMSPEKNFGYLGDGVAEDIISMLARAPDVSVVARNSSFTYEGPARVDIVE
jgi:class 3 adenylate cyclase